MIYVDEFNNVRSMRKEMGQRLKDARIRAGFTSAAAAAEAMKIPQSTYRAHENGQNEFNIEDAQRYAAFFKESDVYLLTGKQALINGDLSTPKIMDSPNAVLRGNVRNEGQSIPVFGRAVGGVDGEFEMNGSLMGHIPAPPHIANVKKAYAVSISGDSMSPRFEDGEICFVDPDRRVKKGDYVIVQVQLEENGPLLAFVKRFCRRNVEELVLEQLNPVKEIRFPEQTVHSVHFISGMVTSDIEWQ